MADGRKTAKVNFTLNQLYELNAGLNSMELLAEDCIRRGENLVESRRSLRACKAAGKKLRTAIDELSQT